MYLTKTLLKFPTESLTFSIIQVDFKYFSIFCLFVFSSVLCPVLNYCLCSYIFCINIKENVSWFFKFLDCGKKWSRGRDDTVTHSQTIIKQTHNKHVVSMFLMLMLTVDVTWQITQVDLCKMKGFNVIWPSSRLFSPLRTLWTVFTLNVFSVCWETLVW